MAGMYELERVKAYLAKVLSAQRVEQCYNLIPNPFNRVNDADKQWVAYVTQASEDITVINAIEEIIEEQGLSRSKKDIIDTVNEVGDFFVSCEEQFKPRIPFYVLVLDKLIP
ncbi:hypothetical protein [Aliarcobacter butzleri]|uniref:hypothetical protein n=1 Tax=Aliarcobacter butzleri TaxID=28197 RepID=UPI000DB7FE18|nr:MAG: hypothetical protein DI567_02320 [Aliarcobacter butzleri]